MEQCKIQPGEETLPQDTMEEILLRVPVKSLLKFRCVSKSWLYLIDDKRFVKTHLQNSIKSFAHHRIILNTSKGLGQCSLPSLLNEPFADSITYNSEFINVEGDMIRLVGCCNGLVCILVDRRRRFILWNPATRKFRNLPDFDNKMEYIWKYGFGFDEVSNDYKVFGIPRRNSNNGYGKVYSLRSNLWKVVEVRDIDSNFPVYCANMGIYASGKLHWYVHDKREIASFDLNNHVYGVVELPTYSEVVYSYRLGVHNGCLILVGVNKKRDDINIWVMKEYGVKETWHQLVTVPYRDNLVAIAPNGEVLLTNRSIIKIYNPKYNSFRYPEIINDAQIFESEIYIESLASVDSDAES